MSDEELGIQLVKIFFGVIFGMLICLGLLKIDQNIVTLNNNVVTLSNLVSHKWYLFLKAKTLTSL